MLNRPAVEPSEAEETALGSAMAGICPAARSPTATAMARRARRGERMVSLIRGAAPRSFRWGSVARRRRCAMPVQPPTIGQLREIAESFGLVLADEDLGS